MPSTLQATLSAIVEEISYETIALKILKQVEEQNKANDDIKKAEIEKRKNLMRYERHFEPVYNSEDVPCIFPIAAN